MMNPIVTVVDYGLGNLFSVSRALEQCGAKVLITDDPTAILNAERLVLPGVGAFADGMAGLEQRGLVGVIQEYARSGRPFLGICLGMQLMFETGHEFGMHRGLGVIPGKVTAIPSLGADGHPHKIPHIGWNELMIPSGRQSWEESILAGVDTRAAVYFVHSFAAQPTDDEIRLADCDYDGLTICAAVQHDSIFGCQFHPEKSGEVGLNIINAFVKLETASAHTLR